MRKTALSSGLIARAAAKGDALHAKFLAHPSSSPWLKDFAKKQLMRGDTIRAKAHQLDLGRKMKGAIMNKQAAFDLGFSSTMIKAADSDKRIEEARKKGRRRGGIAGAITGGLVGASAGGLAGLASGVSTKRARGRAITGALLGGAGGAMLGHRTLRHAAGESAADGQRWRETMDASRRASERHTKSAAFAFAIGKEAAFGEKAGEGAVKTIGGVAKKLVGGKWVDHAPAAGGGILHKLKSLLGGAQQVASSKPIVRTVNVAKARMQKAADANVGAVDALDWVKEGKNRLARAIDAAKSGVGSGGNTMRAANRVAGLTSLQEKTKPAAAAVAGRFKDIADTIKARPKLRGAALSLVREKRI